MKKLAVLILVLAAGCGSDLAPNSEYRSRIGADWHPVTVRAGQVSLASGADSVDCHVKACGWKLLDMRRVKATRDAWFQRGRPKQKWGWKLLIENAGEEPLAIRIDIDLMSNQDVPIGRMRFGGTSHLRPIALGDPGGPVWSDTGRNVVLPGETKVFSDTAWYWLDEHAEAGRPDRVEWSFQHAEGRYGAKGVLQTMAARCSQPSN